MTIFNWLEEITVKKTPPNDFTQEDWDDWNSYMVHRFLSMNINYIDIVNFVQSINPQNKKEIYSVYREYIPKNNKWNKYIKSNIKKHNDILLKYLSEYWECSRNEVREYLNFLGDDEVLRILTSIGLNQKEIKPLLK